MLSSEPNDEVSDTTDDDSSHVAGTSIKSETGARKLETSKLPDFDLSIPIYLWTLPLASPFIKSFTSLSVA